MSELSKSDIVSISLDILAFAFCLLVEGIREGYKGRFELSLYLVYQIWYRLYNWTGGSFNEIVLGLQVPGIYKTILAWPATLLRSYSKNSMNGFLKVEPTIFSNDDVRFIIWLQSNCLPTKAIHDMKALIFRCPQGQANIHVTKFNISGSFTRSYILHAKWCTLSIYICILQPNIPYVKRPTSTEEITI